jgi:hypothetical protein
VTTVRRYGEDTPFGRWVRYQADLDSRMFAFTLNDADWIFHTYAPPIDGKRKRWVQLMLMAEVKTNGAVPSSWQRETLFFMHQRLEGKGSVKKLGGDRMTLWHFGAFFLQFSGTEPSDSDRIRWGQFDKNGEITWKRIQNTEELVEIIGLRTDPQTFEPVDLRAHHSDRIITRRVQTPLGFFIEEVVAVRS